MQTNEARPPCEEDIKIAVENLRRSPRGRRIGNILRILAKEMQKADTANTQAVSQLVGIMASHELNGTLWDHLSEFQLERTQTSENELEVDEVLSWMGCALDFHTYGASVEQVRSVLREAGLAPAKPQESPPAFMQYVARKLGESRGYKFLWLAGWSDVDLEAGRVCELEQDDTGQWRYRILEGGRMLVDWQYGSLDLPATLEQARSRFVFDRHEIRDA